MKCPEKSVISCNTLMTPLVVYDVVLKLHKLPFYECKMSVECTQM